MAQWAAHIKRLTRHNVATLRSSPWAELSGSLGDLGTLLPLMVALALQDSIQLGSTLVFSGIFNILTGLLFGIPLPVQPMKAIASAAISAREDPSMDVVIAAGQYVGAAVLVLSVTGLLQWIVRVVPLPVVKGIQLGAGLSLVIGAGSSLLKPLRWVDPALDNRVWALAAFIVLVMSQRLPRFPYALCFFVMSILFAAVSIGTKDNARAPGLQFWHPRLVMPEWVNGHDSPALWMAIGQLPLTTLNSIIAVSQLSSDLLPDLPAPSVTSMGLSVAFMNLTGTWFGSMPMCHGAGGLAAQYRFGARSGASVVMLGFFKLVSGLFFGETLVDLLRYYPKSLLGIMVFASGLELAKVGNSLNNGAPDLWQAAAGLRNRRQRELTDEERMERWTVMLTTAGGILAFRNDALGFLAGLLCHGAYELDRYLRERHTKQTRPATERDRLLQ
ncbi:Molybdate transporter 1 [Emericellopsis cladophorae]|uniref:Molybdate transporter 1 n=1 Tax=Emericellopsis cladophorae TaxID=2686198 RepID=A0A9P9Y1X0_9HYPO|nr:Molybdate transporter 1 [Emericellopsis cladophorae]KAI6782019.1 Molybdate transporter 1 [Emericellopsis cladophorae]